MHRSGRMSMTSIRRFIKRLMHSSKRTVKHLQCPRMSAQWLMNAMFDAWWKHGQCTTSDKCDD